MKDILIPSEEYRIKMYPMDFEEYLWALGDTVTVPVIKEAFKKRKPLGDAIHRKIMKNFRTYMVVEGMPQAVAAFVDGRTFAQIDFVKRNILSLYEEDLAKYDDDNREKASIVYRTIPEQLENKNSHFKFSLVDTGLLVTQIMNNRDETDEDGRTLYHLYERLKISGWYCVFANLYDYVDLMCVMIIINILKKIHKSCEDIRISIIRRQKI